MTIETGRETYLFHCAACHGRDGRGDGPMVPVLKAPPPDLRTMARRSGRRFRRSDVSAFILGTRRVPAAHGSRDMPAWGPLFVRLNPFDSRVDVRLTRLLDYLESMQLE